jgi:hypothetical protein
VIILDKINEYFLLDRTNKQLPVQR